MQISKIKISGVNDTPLGTIWLAMHTAGLLAIEIGGNHAQFIVQLKNRFGAPVRVEPGEFAEPASQIRDYLDGKRQNFELPIAWASMSDFQQTVLKSVYQIPYGETRHYGQLAAQIGKPGAARAVGRANATNPLPLVIPCHRLIGADGSLRGYGTGAGLVTKAWLLALEKKLGNYCEG